MTAETAFRSGLAAALATAVLAAIVVSPAPAQPPPPPPDQRPARERAPIDLTGQWVSVVTEDWRWRMVTPPVGDVASLPLNTRGRAVAEAWDLERDRIEGNFCKAFGPPALIRQPTRLRVSWESDDTLRLDFDAGSQTRWLHFGAVAPGAPSLQGHSEARWFRQTQSRGVFGVRTPQSGGALHVRTTNLTPGYLRPNGVPYSERAVIKEFFNTFTLPDNKGTWLVVTTVVSDPEYLTTDLVMSTQFKRETDGARWSPRPCDIPPPLVTRAAE